MDIFKRPVFLLDITKKSKHCCFIGLFFLLDVASHVLQKFRPFQRTPNSEISAWYQHSCWAKFIWQNQYPRNDSTVHDKTHKQSRDQFLWRNEGSLSCVQIWYNLILRWTTSFFGQATCCAAIRGPPRLGVPSFYSAKNSIQWTCYLEKICLFQKRR